MHSNSVSRGTLTVQPTYDFEAHFGDLKRNE